MKLEAVVGRGGMAEVYRATTADGETVAVKVMRAELAAVRRHREAFFREIRSVAQLQHPCIVEVKGLGQVSAEEAEASNGKLVVTTPYLVMDHITGGTLPAKPSHYDWPTLQQVLIDLLDALAHAHASGVVHRDLKTANVLLESRDDLRSIRLTDFGIARVFDGDEPPPEGSVNRVSGTPSTMAPEQVTGRWRDEGPWTDLYALGIVAWGLASGKRPFDGDTVEVLRAHVQSPLPPFEPAFPVPESFVAWLRKMLAKDPRDRFQFAADAMYGLLTLGDHVPEWTAAPTPLRWQRPQDHRTRNAPMGLELFALRSAPMVGRLGERDRLWDVVTAAREGHSPTLTLITASSGLGKTRLLDWIHQRTRELGSANVLRAQYHAYSGSADGLGAMLERHFRTGGLDRDSVIERVESIQSGMGIDPAEAANDRMVLVDLIRPRDGVGLRHRSQREVYLAVIRLLEHLSRERPVLLCFEDVQRSHEAVRFIEVVLGHAPRGVAVVATLERNAESEQIAARLLSLDRATELALEPLSAEHIGALAQSLVHVPADVIRRIVRTVEGNPRAAIEVATSWARTGRLESDDPSTAAFTVASVWRGAVERVCAGSEVGADEALLLVQLAAVLGTAVELDDWSAAARYLGLTVPPSLIEAMVLEGVLLQRNEALLFRTNDAVERIRDGARGTTRWQRLHAACAAVLAERFHDSIDPRQLLRVARHEVAAELWTQAFQTLERAGIRTHHVSPEDSRAVWELRAEALRRANAPPDHEQFLWNDTLEASLAVYAGDTDRAVEISEEVVVKASVPGRERLLGYVCRNLAVLLAPRDPLRSAFFYDLAIETYESIGERELAGITLCNSVNLHAIMGQMGEARKRLDRAQKVLMGSTSAEAAVELVYQEGQLARLDGKLESARWRFEKAARLATDVGWMARAALALSDGADVTRMLGDLDHAETTLREVLRIAQTMGQQQHAETIRMNLCLIASQRGDYETAWTLACQARDAGLQGAVTHFVAAVALPAAAGTGRFDELDIALSACEDLSTKFGITDWDLAWTARHAGELAATAGQVDRATRAFRLALAQLRALGSEEADDVAASLAQLAETNGHG